MSDTTAMGVIADLLASTLMRGHEEGRRHLYIWEARGLTLLARSLDGTNAWTADRARAYANGKPILPGWSPDTYPIEWVESAAGNE